MKLISEMSFDECLAELQGIIYTKKVNSERISKGTERRKTYLAESMIKLDWKRFFKIFQDQFDEFSHLIVRKAVQESPIMLLESLQIAPRRLDLALSYIPEVTPPSLRKKQVDVIVKCIQDGMNFGNISYWNDFFEILEKHRPEALETICENWLKELSDDNTCKPTGKIDQAENFLNKFNHLLSDTSKSQLGLCIEDYKNQLRIEQIAQHDSYAQKVIKDIKKSISELDKFAQSVNDEFIDNQLKIDLKNKEELLTYDMEFTDNLYHSLNKDMIFIAHGDDEMQYESSPFYVLNDIQKLLYDLDDFFNMNDLELDLNELIQELKHASEKRFASYLDGYEPSDYGFESGWLYEIATVEHNEWEGAYAGIAYYYFIRENDYSETVLELKNICLILINWARKTVNQ